ncbi:MAG TPA: hypothetical protein VJ373_01060 [Desulfatiglandales bacterium]|nr:hypothetical protein [Desulfatiglandales bacterium]
MTSRFREIGKASSRDRISDMIKRIMIAEEKAILKLVNTIR